MVWSILAWTLGALLLLVVTFVAIVVVLYLRADFLEPKEDIDLDAIVKHNEATLRQNRF